MISNWVNIARAFKALHDLTFSEEPFYVSSRTELRNGARHAVEQFQTGLSQPPAERPPLIRWPFKIILYILLALCLVSIVLGGIQ
jgi:hypothetical protein